MVRIGFSTLEPHRAAITVMQNDWNYLRSLPGDRFDYLVKAEDEVEKAKLAARKPEAAAAILPTSESGPRQYLGYIVRVYYKDQLQAVRAEPTRLLNLFPPPFTAPPQ